MRSIKFMIVGLLFIHFNCSNKLLSSRATNCKKQINYEAYSGEFGSKISIRPDSFFYFFYERDNPEFRTVRNGTWRIYGDSLILEMHSPQSAKIKFRIDGDTLKGNSNYTKFIKVFSSKQYDLRNFKNSK